MDGKRRNNNAGEKNDKNQEEKPKTYMCKRGCNQRFAWKTQLYRHKKVCKGKSPKKIKEGYRKDGNEYTCLKCEKNFTHQPNVIRHVSNCKLKEKEVHQCSFCDKTFSYKSILMRHEKTHSNDIAVPSFVTPHGENILDVSTEIDPQPSSTSCIQKVDGKYQCEVCQKHFAWKSHLVRHEKTHNNDMATASFVPLNSSGNQETLNRPGDDEFPTDIDFTLNQPSSSTFIEDSSFNSLSYDDNSSFTDITESVTDLADTDNATGDTSLLRTELGDNRESSESSLDDVHPLHEEIHHVHPLDEEFEEIDVPTLEETEEIDDASLLKSLFKYLRGLHKEHNVTFKKRVIEIFGVERLADHKFQYFLASKLDINYQNFKRGMMKWMDSGMEETRGRNKLNIETRQEIYDMWIQNAQPSTDNRNNRCQVKISEVQYIEKFSGLKNTNVEIEYTTNKRGRKNVAANRMISTTTTKGIIKKLSDKGVEVPFGSVINNKPFFITYATEKELSLCLCKLCINMTFLFEPLMARAKKDGDETFQSISSFLMHNSTCAKSANGYYEWNCAGRKCKDCTKLPPAELQCMNSDDLVSVDQFETVTKEYDKINKTTNLVEKKTTKLTDRTKTRMTYKDLYKKISTMRKTYMIHKYHVYNDKHHWPKILATVPEYGDIYHSDYSENMSQLHRREAQSCHFNKTNYSLHCTVQHVDPGKYPDLKSPYLYLYHFSDCMKHNFAYTSIVANHCIDHNTTLPEIIRRKNDNCGVQYKCSDVFGEYQIMSKKFNRKVLIYYGPSGHGKGLVDAMSAFGVKGPLLRKVLTEEFSYNSSEDICTAMKEHFEGDPQKHYFVIPAADILGKEKNKVVIPGCVKYAYHMISFFPSGKILAKVNMCSCDNCLVGDFDLCQIEKCINVQSQSQVDENDGYETDSDIEYEDDDFGDDVEPNMELYEMRSESVLQLTQPGNVVALFTPVKTVLQLFYLSRVTSIGEATKEDMNTIFKNHPLISEGSPFLKVQPFEKKPGSEFSKSGTVVYTPIRKAEYVLPTHVMFPQVNHIAIGKDIHITIQEYQWLCDSIGQY